ncbi:hypothetical protein ACOMHN_037835 [Nucella lapillus]
MSGPPQDKQFSEQTDGNGSEGKQVKSKESQQSGSTGSSLKVLLKKANLQVTPGSSPVCATVIHPGLSPETFSFTGIPEIASLLKAVSVARIYAMNMPVDEKGNTFFEYDKITRGTYAFMYSTLVDIFPGMYDFAVPKTPLEVKVQGGHIGRTSLSTVSTVTCPAISDQQTLLTQISQVVVVDRATRRPLPIEDHWRDKYQGHCVRGEPLIVKQQEVPPSGPLSVYETKIAWNDIDFYNHTTFSHYPRFALNAVHDALRHGRLQGHLTEEAFKAGVRQVKVCYLGESTEGDVLKIQVWPGEAEGNRCVVVCSMEKEGRVITQVTLTF